MPVGCDHRFQFNTMSTATRKRTRGHDDGAAAMTEVRTVAETECLALRVADATPPFWFHAAKSAGISGTDAFLVHLGRSISAALQSVIEESDVARIHLRDARAALHSAIDARFDRLGADIDSAETTKTAALERELVSVDAALQRWRSESGAVHEWLLSKSETGNVDLHVDLSSRLDSMEAQLQSLPTAVVEPPFVGLSADTSALS